MITLEHEPNWKLEINLECSSDIMNDDDIGIYLDKIMDNIVINIQMMNDEARESKVFPQINVCETKLGKI